ncbi:MAG: carboxypeptidase-like regulatory domain-containing protein [Bacteroidales bacterium]|nr:carboxypeptidase-like regulatory domain-containing protein [Bacteroidales bacterium]
MAERKKYKKTNFAGYLNYFKGLLSGKEQHALEKEMMQDVFEEEAFEGMSSVSPDELEEDILELHKKINRRIGKKKYRIIPILRYAAAVVLLLAVGSLAILVKKSSDYKSPVKKETAMKDSSKGMPAFASKIKDSVNVKPTKTIPKEKQDVIAVQTRKEQEMVAPVSSKLIAKSHLKEAEAPETTQVIPVEYDMIALKKQIETEQQIEVSALSYNEDTEQNNLIIRGQVISGSEDLPLPGVNVRIKGTTKGVVTDLDGNFSIEIPTDQQSTLAFDFLGYKSEEIEISDNKDITVNLTEDIIALEEVVVVGYGTMKKSDLTGAVVTIESKDLESQEEFAQIVVPKPSEGMMNYKKYIKENIRYENLPEFDKNQVVQLAFEVTASGDITNIHSVKSPGTNFEQEAIRLIKDGPAWEPGTIDGTRSTQTVTLRIKFSPE